MAIRTITLRNFGKFMDKLPSNIRKELGSELTHAIAQDFGKRARGRAKGRLRSMTVSTTDKNQAVVKYRDNETLRIARHVNAGRYPKFKIPAVLMEMSRAGERTADRKARDVIDLSSVPPELRHFVQPGPSSSKGFLDSAFKDTVAKTPSIILKKYKEAINKSL